MPGHAARSAVLPLPEDVPPEILGKIFQFIVFDAEGYTIPSQLLTLCLVCRSWYEAALLDHQIWGRLHLNWMEGTSPSYEVVVTWLNRVPAAFRAIKASFAGMCDCYEAWDTPGDIFWNECGSHILHRVLKDGPIVYHLDLECMNSPCFDRLCRITQLSSQHPGIESLSLTVTHSWVYEVPWITPFHHSPRVRSLRLNLCQANLFDLGPLSTPEYLSISPEICHDLTSLSIHFPEFDECPDYITEVLSLCTNLDTLALAYHHFGGDHTPSQPPPITTLPKLKVVKLCGMAPRSRPTVIYYLRAPALTDLTLRMSTYPPLTPYEGSPHVILGIMHSLGVLSPESAGLRSFTLLGEGPRDAVGSDELAGILTALPNLRNLSLDAIRYDAENFLTASRRSPSFIPALGHLDLQSLQSGFELQHVFQFIEDRAREGGSGFRRLTFSHHRKHSALDRIYTTSTIVPELRTVYGVNVVRVLL